MVRYCYYDPASMQIEGVFETPQLSDQANWVVRGLTRALIPADMIVTRNHRIIQIDSGDYILGVDQHMNPVQPPHPLTDPFN